jgi:predicted RNase H-like HicB family nuclease
VHCDELKTEQTVSVVGSAASPTAWGDYVNKDQPGACRFGDAKCPMPLRFCEGRCVSVAHYISVLMPLSAGGWRALFPDIPGCEVEGDSLDATVLRAAGALTECVHSRYGDGPPSPRELIEIKADDHWVTSHAIDWAKAVVTMVPLRDGHNGHP